MNITKVINTVLFHQCRIMQTLTNFVLITKFIHREKQRYNSVEYYIFPKLGHVMCST